MARPKSVSDEEILNAARLVITRSGYDRFTLAEVAAEVGLSRAAIILRFRSTQALKVRLITEGVQKFLDRLELLPSRRGGDGLLDLADFLAGLVQVPGNSSNFLRNLQGVNRDPELAAVERLRAQAWHSAIVQRMPETGIDLDDAAYLFSAMLVGAIAQWEASPAASSADHLQKRARDWLILAGIEFTPRPAQARASPSREQ